MRQITHLPIIFLLVLMTAITSPRGLWPIGDLGAALADDDDGDDDDDDDDDGDNDDDGGADDNDGTSNDDDDDDGTRTITRQPRAEGGPIGDGVSTLPLPDRAAGEIVTLGLSPADLSTLEMEGYLVIETRAIGPLGLLSRRLRVPPDTPLDLARARVRALQTGAASDFNHFYRSEQGFSETCRGADCPARLSVGWPLLPSRNAGCGSTTTIGMIDTGINAAHETFSGARLEVHRLTALPHVPSQAAHGTAVAALLVGDPATRAPGLVPGARVVAVDAFHSTANDERTDVFSLVDALGFLAESGAQVINLGLAGPDNAVLAKTVEQLANQGDIVLVAAVGNAGPRAAPAYPAAYDPVIAVTAVDRDGTVYRRAGQGPHVDLAAPGVNIWTAASISGARFKTGTSFAVPFVSAAAAILREIHPEMRAADIAEELRRRTIDLGPPGPDEIYGAGLLDAAPLCKRPI